MQAVILSPRAGPGVPINIGIHDLLEQSISRSRHGAGASIDSAAAAPQSSTNFSQSRSTASNPRPQSKQARSPERAALQETSASQAATPRASTASWEEENDGHMSRTAMPERRQLEYSASDSNTDHAADFRTKGKRSAYSQMSAKKKADRVPRVPSPLNRLHSTPVAAMLLGSEQNEPAEARPDSTPGPIGTRAQEAVKTQRPLASARRLSSPLRPSTHAGEGVGFRSEAVAMEVQLKERLSKLDLDLPPSATMHRHHGRLKLAQHTLATLCRSPMLATEGLLVFVQDEYDRALNGSMQEAQQASTMSASLAKTNWINSGLRSQVQTLQSRLSDSNGLTAKLQREMLLVKAKAEALEFSVSEKDAEIDLLRQRQERQETQIVQLMEDKEFLVAQQAKDPGGTQTTPPRVLQMKGNVMNRISKYANEAILSVEDIRNMDEAAFVASLHNVDESNQ